MRFVFVVLLFIPLTVFNQGGIEHIRNQDYMQHRSGVNCDSLDGDNLSEKICANLAYQRSDSLLVLAYDSLILAIKTDGAKEEMAKVQELQATWRKFRDQHCAIIFNRFEGCGGCHQRSIDYLNCLRRLTDDRTKQLNDLRRQFSPLMSQDD